MNPGLTDRQWPGFSPRSHPYGLAGTYVFIKQSDPPGHCDLPLQGHYSGRHPFFRRYGTNLPSSLDRVNPQTPWASHLGAPVSVLGTVPEDRSELPFHGDQGSGEPPIREAHRTFAPFSPLRLSRGLSTWVGRWPHSPYPDPSGARLALPHLPPRQGNINPFPFRQVPVRPCLRTGSLPADDHCRETLALPARGILTPFRYYCRRDLHPRMVQWTSRPTF